MCALSLPDGKDSWILEVVSCCSDFVEKLEGLSFCLEHLGFFAHAASMQYVQKKGRV